MVATMALSRGMVWEKFAAKRPGFGFVKELALKGDAHAWCWESRTSATDP